MIMQCSMTESCCFSLRGEADSLDSLPAFEEQMWQQAAVIRHQWLRLGTGAKWLIYLERKGDLLCFGQLSCGDMLLI